MSNTVYGITKTPDPFLEIVELEHNRFALRKRGYVLFVGTHAQCKERVPLHIETEDRERQNAFLGRAIS